MQNCPKIVRLAGGATHILSPPVSQQKRVVLSCCLGAHVSDFGEQLVIINHFVTIMYYSSLPVNDVATLVFIS